MSRPESFLGDVVEWDDAHIPESVRCGGSLVKYERWLQRPPVVMVADSGQHAVTEQQCEALYHYTVHQKLPWGTYITMEDVKDYWERQREGLGAVETRQTIATYTEEEHEHRLSLPAVSAFLQEALKNSNLWTQDDMQQAHGVAVWALASEAGSSVPYHLDYAEQIRYDTNIIVPPILAGTLQCTKSTIVGGKYCTNLQGLEHYQRHGYKGKRSAYSDARDFLQDADEKHQWIAIDYRFNRIICQSGHLPHLSTTVEEIQDPFSKRVIVGFNVFLSDIGPMVQQAPEHSDAFRDQVAWRRRQNKLSLETIRQNPSLSKLLVLAKREKERQELVRKQQWMDDVLMRLLHESSSPLSLQDLLHRISSECTNNNDASELSVSVVDIHIHLHRQYCKGVFRLVQKSVESGGAMVVKPDRDQDGLIALDSLVDVDAS